ncbi:putative ribonuclease H-like domain-containing protein [Tanacetum coccineum]
MRPFRCPVIILNIIHHLGKFDGKDDEGFFVGYSTNRKAFRVFNSRTKIVEENLHVKFIVVGNQSNGNASRKACDNAGKARMETIPSKDYLLLPLSIQDPPFSSSLKDSPDAGFKPSGEEEKKDAEDLGNEGGNPTEGKYSKVSSTEEPRINQEKDDNINSTNNINTASDGNSTNNVNIVSSTFNSAGLEVNVVWTLVDLPNGKRANGTKWVYRNKKDERGIVIKHNARLVAQGYTQEEGINYDEMDVKSTFLYGKIEEEVYVCQPPRFEDPDFHDRVYKVEKALYGLHQAPRAWYETLSTYLLDNGFQREKIDKNLFIKRDKGDKLLV